MRALADLSCQAGVGYQVYELPVDATSAEVKAEIAELNDDHGIHGILIQRPLPSHLDELKLMASVAPHKHIEESIAGEPSNIAADALTRLLTRYDLEDLAHRRGIHIAGFGNIITDGFIAHLRDHYPHILVSRTLPDLMAEKKVKYPVLVSELHAGPHFITSNKLSRDERVIIDLGFFVTENGIAGDVDPSLYDEEDLAIAATPGGLLPILLWLMMERTIKSCHFMNKSLSLPCICQ